MVCKRGLQFCGLANAHRMRRSGIGRVWPLWGLCSLLSLCLTRLRLLTPSIERRNNVILRMLATPGRRFADRLGSSRTAMVTPALMRLKPATLQCLLHLPQRNVYHLRTKRTDSHYDTLPAFVGIQLHQLEVRMVNSKIDTFYYKANPCPQHQVQYFVKNFDGSFTEFKWTGTIQDTHSVPPPSTVAFRSYQNLSQKKNSTGGHHPLWWHGIVWFSGVVQHQDH